jgi:glucose-6-phosphate 1-dehydrogenase
MQDNPLNDGLRLEPTPGPATLVIFGASGDLTKRKLLPAVYRLSKRGRLPAQFAVIGIARSEMGDDDFRTQFRDCLKEFIGPDSWDDVAKSLAGRMYYVSAETDDPEVYRRLKLRLEVIDGAEGVLFYLATPPSVYGTVIQHLGAAGLSRPPERGWRRVIVEKPFGTDLASARALNHLAHQHFDEDQVYRIDHYLGKETVQNLLVFRFGNGMFEPVWNRRYIDHVQITAAETVGVEHRASYYEGAGAMRDMLQNHLMQVVALVAMEPPIAFTAESVRDRKMDALLAVQPLVEGSEANGQNPHVVRAQYGAGWVNGAEVPGYLSEKGVSRQSMTETFVAVRILLDNWRWAGVPFYVRTGKRLPKRTTEISIQFRRPPLEIFRRASQTPVAPDLLIVNVQPDEGISLRFEAKLPGTRMQIAPVMMNFRYGTTFGGDVPEAYETLLLDAMLGDATLFARHDFVESSWALITPVLEGWTAGVNDRTQGLPAYEAGEWGPPEADALMERDGRRWRRL